MSQKCSNDEVAEHVHGDIVLNVEDNVPMNGQNLSIDEDADLMNGQNLSINEGR
jgi:hypothetical protein